MKTLSGRLVFFAVGTALGLGFGFWFSKLQQSPVTADMDKAQEPLYWVAPMDASFRRNSPGKSPMGMDLVPVYRQDTPIKGAVKISANVEHNLGVRTARVRRGQMKNKITTLADVQYNEDLMVNVYPRVAGWVETLYVKSTGESVEAGQALYEIYSPELVNAQQEMITALTQGNKALVASSRERLKSLQVAESDINRLMQARANERIAKRTITIYAPRAGIVSHLGIREGNFVTPGTQIMAIAGTESVWITADIFENDMTSIKLGDPIVFEFGSLAGVKQFSKVDFIYPRLDKMTRTLKIRSTVANEDGRLIANMYAKATIQPRSIEQVTLVPKNAVIPTASQNRVVLKLGDGHYKSVSVLVGRVNNTEAEILDGLEPGDEVVVQAQFLLDSESSISSDFIRMGLMDMQRAEPAAQKMDHSQMDSGSVGETTHD